MFKYPKHVGFTCTRCGQCCGDTKDRIRHVLLLKTDVEQISNKTLLDICNFAEKISGFEPYIYQMKKTEHGKCFFLKNNKCTIYKIRPLICRFYPFHLQTLGNNSYSFFYTKNCKGINNQTKLERSFFEKFFNQFKKAMKKNMDNYILTGDL